MLKELRRRLRDEHNVWMHMCKEKGPTLFGFPLHGRAWLHLGQRLTLSLEWIHFYSSSAGVELRVGAERVSGHASFGPGLFWGVEAPWTYKLAENLGMGYGARAVSLDVFDSAIWWKVWANDNGWSSDTPRWRDGCWHVLDTLLGKSAHRVVDSTTYKVVIPMPEGVYPGTIEMKTEEWKRPRWYAHTFTRAHYTLEKGIPFPGKGENSWDCDDDGLGGGCIPAKSLPEAIAGIVRTCLEYRQKRGHTDGTVKAWEAVYP
jgi:hypothetical protein